MNVEIPGDLTPFVQQMIAGGSYRNEGELLIEGLRLLRSREQLRVDVDAGIAQLEAGQGKNGNEVFARLRNVLANFAPGTIVKWPSSLSLPWPNRTLTKSWSSLLAISRKQHCVGPATSKYLCVFGKQSRSRQLASRVPHG